MSTQPENPVSTQKPAEGPQDGFCDKHRPSAGRSYAGCWVCSRQEDTGWLIEVVKAFGFACDTEAGWYLIGDEDKVYGLDLHGAVRKSLDAYDELREAHKKARLFAAKQQSADAPAAPTPAVAPPIEARTGEQMATEWLTRECETNSTQQFAQLMFDNWADMIELLTAYYAACRETENEDAKS